MQDNRTSQHDKKSKSFGGQQGKPIFKSKINEEKAIDHLIKEQDDLTLSETLHTLHTRLQINYNFFYSHIENAYKETHQVQQEVTVE